ncbi:DHA2 family efflux MFS transporter permease subunit [Leadbetterella sp. DM7]|uniref:DHA2 family efflux MFS transporter permease subunit n=1 Tax=Leadbetterella sp. DM7 TaxID=3235085 RepID=UPI00349ED261
MTEKETVKRYLPMVLSIAIFMQMLDSTILNTSLPAIARDFGESSLNMQNAIIAYVLTLALFMPVSGFLADKYGTRRIFIFALVLFASGSVFCGFSSNLTQLVIARVVQGVGGSLMTPVAKLALIKAFPKNELVKAMNFAIIPALIGPILGPLVGGYMVDYLSWHWIFLINVPISLVGLAMGLKYMPDYRSQVIDFDFKGFLIFAAASLLLSISAELFTDAHNVTPVLLMVILGFVLVFFYFKHSHTDNNPIFPFSLFQVRTFRLGILGNLATRLGISSIGLLVPLLIQVAYGKSAVVSGWLIAPMALTAIFGKSFVIAILNRFGYRTTLMANTAIIGVIICLFAIPGENTPIIWFLPIVALLGFFNSIQFTSMNTISIADLREYQNSSGNSLISVNQQLAIGFGISFGLIVLRSFEGALHGQSIHTAFRYTFLVMGVTTIISGLLFRRLHVSDGKNLRTAP